LMPRVPTVTPAADFTAFSRIGRAQKFDEKRQYFASAS
jgi:hypothetical protein